MVREHNTTGAEAETAGTAVLLTGSWQQIRVSRTVANAGMSHVDVYVAQGGGVVGDHFFADDFSLTAGSGVPAPTATVVRGKYKMRLPLVTKLGSQP